MYDRVKGGEAAHGYPIDYMGIQNEGSPPGGALAFSIALRTKLDGAGLQHTLVDCCDSHDFSFDNYLSNDTWVKSVAALAVHEPLRSAESVPQAAIDSGKDIFSSEAYTTYSDSNGGGCWAR
jgi:hypothetical protein